VGGCMQSVSVGKIKRTACVLDCLIYELNCHEQTKRTLTPTHWDSPPKAMRKIFGFGQCGSRTPHYDYANKLG
jgi:hypothetical protein